MLTLTYARLVLLSCEALSTSALTLSCGSARLVVGTLNNLSIISFKEILTSWLCRTTFARAVFKLIILLVDTVLSNFTLGLLACTMTDEIGIGLS